MEEARANCPTCGAAFPAGATFCPKCGYVVPVTSPVTAAELLISTPPAPQSNVVYVQPPALTPEPAPQANWGPWVAIAAVILVIGGGFALYSGGYIGGGGPAATPSTISIDNSPKISSDTPGKPDLVVTTSPPPAAAPPSVIVVPSATPAPVPTPAPPNGIPNIDIISVKGQALSTGPVEWKYGYTLRLRNNTNKDVSSNFRVQFLDESGFPVDDDVMNNLEIPAGSELSFDGDDMIKAGLAQRIKTLRAEVR